jgi:hypothetical protein
MVLQPRCWVPCTPLVLPCSLGLVKRSLWGPLLRALRLPVRLCHFLWFSPIICALRLPVRLRRFVWYYTRLWFCSRSEIDSMTSRFWCLSPRHLVTTTPLSGIKLLTRCLQQIILVAKPTAVKIGPSQDLSLKRSLSCGIRGIIVTVGFVIIHKFTLYSTICYWFVRVLKSTEKATKKTYSPFGGTVTLCVAFIWLLVAIVVLPPCFICFSCIRALIYVIVVSWKKYKQKKVWRKKFKKKSEKLKGLSWGLCNFKFQICNPKLLVF